MKEKWVVWEWRKPWGNEIPSESAWSTRVKEYYRRWQATSSASAHGSDKASPRLRMADHPDEPECECSQWVAIALSSSDNLETLPPESAFSSVPSLSCSGQPWELHEDAANLQSILIFSRRENVLSTFIFSRISPDFYKSLCISELSILIWIKYIFGWWCMFLYGYKIIRSEASFTK